MTHINQAIGIADYRQNQCAITNRNKDPERLLFAIKDSIEHLQQAHSSSIAWQHYGLNMVVPHGEEEVIKAYRRASIWWQDLTGGHPLTLIT
jgi:hypothetical protein